MLLAPEVWAFNHISVGEGLLLLQGIMKWVYIPRNLVN
jgi:hypothetical protein